MAASAGEGNLVTKVMLLLAVGKLLVTTYALSNKVKFFRQSHNFVDKRSIEMSGRVVGHS